MKRRSADTSATFILHAEYDTIQLPQAKNPVVKSILDEMAKKLIILGQVT